MSTDSSQSIYLKSSLSFFFFPHLKTFPLPCLPLSFSSTQMMVADSLASASSEQIASVYFHLGGFCIHSIITEVKSSAPILKFHIFLLVFLLCRKQTSWSLRLTHATICLWMYYFSTRHIIQKLMINPILCLTSLPQHKFFTYFEYPSCLISLPLLSYYTSSAFRFVWIPMSSILAIL